MMGAAVAKNLLRTFREAREKTPTLQKVREYRGFLNIEHETNDFVVKTAIHGVDLLRVLELRHLVFVEEWQGRKAFHGLDVDAHDFVADHLMIIDKRTTEVIGTYRLLSSHFTHSFYSSGEFEIGEFLRLPAVKLEMGRACVHPNYRDGNVIDLLWKGLSQYIIKSKTEYLFGCASVKTTNPQAISRLLRTVKDQGAWSEQYHITATGNYFFPGVIMDGPEAMSAEEKRVLLPPLLRSYLHAGAKVYGAPALDRVFACTDVLTILDWKDLHRRFQSRFVEA
ncbi:MAG: GNAT family N-acetyltransferase [Bdellovibrionales bacterium]|nr:GNAT family N-acetyltransferase [Bdellovibrionales bacterium]